MCKAIENYMNQCAKSEKRLSPQKLSKIKKAKKYNRKKLIRKLFGNTTVRGRPRKVPEVTKK